MVGAGGINLVGEGNRQRRRRQKRTGEKIDGEDVKEESWDGATIKSTRSKFNEFRDKL